MDEKVYSADCLQRLLPNFSFYINKTPQISLETLNFFKCGLAMSGKMNGRIVFPIYKQDGKINGFSGRDVMNRESAPKWKHLCNRRFWAYPFFVPDAEGKFPIDEKIRDSKNIVLVESIGDALNCYENKIRNIGVTFGLDVSKALLSYLISCDLDKITLSMNNDDCPSYSENHGLIAALKNYLILSQFFSLEKIEIKLPVKNDFGDMNVQDFNKWKESEPINQQAIKNMCEDLFNKGKIPKKYKNAICQI